jgi:hypothetical protein
MCLLMSCYRILLTYLLTYLLTHSMMQDIIWKADCHSACQKILLSLWNPKVHYHVHKSPPLDPILSQLNPVRSIDPYLPKVHVLFPLLRSCQRISPGPRRFETFRNVLQFYSEGLLTHAQPSSSSTTPCLLSATSYSIYSQLPSISVGFLLHPQPEDTPCRGDKRPHLIWLHLVIFSILLSASCLYMSSLSLFP